MTKTNSNTALLHYAWKKLPIRTFLIHPMNLNRSEHITVFIYQAKQKRTFNFTPIRSVVRLIPFLKAINQSINSYFQRMSKCNENIQIRLLMPPQLTYTNKIVDVLLCSQHSNKYFCVHKRGQMRPHQTAFCNLVYTIECIVYLCVLNRMQWVLLCTQLASLMYLDIHRISL